MGLKGKVTNKPDRALCALAPLRLSSVYPGDHKTKREGNQAHRNRKIEQN
jgi:hypothetical protein